MSSSLLIRTPRLELIAATLDLIAAELEGPEALSALLGVPVPLGWPPGEYDREALEFFTALLVSGGPAALGWYNWYAIAVGADGRREALVGGAGYLGPPAEGVVEIGYSVMPQTRGRGFATEIVEALTTRALSLEAVRIVVAHTLDSNTASQGVLRRCGFLPVEEGATPGLLRFERARSGP